MFDRVKNRKHPPLRSYLPTFLVLAVFFLAFRQIPQVGHGAHNKFSLSAGLHELFSQVKELAFGDDAHTLKIAVIECPGGTDKGPDGHREDSKYLVDGILAQGVEAKLFQYTDKSFDAVFKDISRVYKADAYVSRVDPGEYEACDEGKYFKFLEKLIEAKILPFNSPSDMLNLGSKKSLLNLAGMYYFPNSTYVYSSIDQFDAFFPRTLKLHRSRVIKQNRGSKGEGVWWVKLLDSNYSKEKPKVEDKVEGFNPFSRDYLVSRFLSLPFISSFSKDSSAEDSSWKGENSVPLFQDKLLPEFSLMENCSKDGGECLDPKVIENEEKTEMDHILVKLVEAKDNHHETMTLKKFRNSVIKGYLNTTDDFVVDMEYLPRIAEGEVRLILSGKNVLFVVNKQPQKGEDGAFSANLGAGAQHKWDSPEKWGHLVEPFSKNLDLMLSKMNVQHAPIFWTVDFIRYGDVPTEASSEDSSKSHFVISEINASCVGFSANPEMGAVIAKILVDSIRRLLNK